MSDTLRASSRSLQAALKHVPPEDSSLKGKWTTLSASIKAYNTRMNNLQNEAQSIQAEADTMLKLMWGIDSAEGASFTSPPKDMGEAPVADGTTRSDDFSVDPPPISRVLEEKMPNVECVEAERVSGTAAASTEGGQEAGEIEVETIEVEGADDGGSNSAADSMKITDITADLYERGINFSDCLDARSLRQRYRDVLDGRIKSTTEASGKSSPYTEPLSTGGISQPRMPSTPRKEDYNQQQQRQAPPDSSSTGITSDPYPNAHRKMVDPMKFVSEIKVELAQEKGIDPSNVDLWSGRVKLDDHKRLYDYPSVQSYPIEVRQKGDVPR